jgi:hypothetical protein
MSKLCISCGERKPFADFTGNKNQCKLCRARNAIEYRKSKKSASVSDDIKNMREQVHKMTMVLDDEDIITEKYEKLSKIIQEMYRLNELTADSIVMELKLDIPEELHNFLVQIQEGDPNSNYVTVRMAHIYLTEDGYEDGFEQHFGIKRSELTKYSEMLLDIYHITGLVKGAYLAMVDDLIKKNNSKFVPPSEHGIDSSFRANVYIKFDSKSDCIIAEGNHLRLERKTFLAKLEDLLKRENINVMMYQKTGYYDKFMKLLVDV